jgi:hypothetical protein
MCIRDRVIRGGYDQGNTCLGQVGDCPSVTVARKDAYFASLRMLPVGVPVFVGGGEIPTAFAGGYTAQNASYFALSNFSGKLNFTYAGPHFKAVSPGNTPNTGFYKTLIPSQAVADVFNLPGANAAELQTLMSASDSEVGGSTTSRSVVVDDVAGGVKISLPSITFSSHNVEITASARVAQPSSGSSSGTSGGTTSTPAAVTVSTPVIVPAVPTVVAVPVAPVAPLRNPVTAVSVTPTVQLVSESEANAAPVRSMSNPPALLITKAPVVNSTAGKIVSLTTQGLEPGTNYEVKLKVNGKYVNLGEVKTDSSGKVSLPAFKPSAPGTYIVAVVNPVTGKTGYVKVTVPPKRK